MKREITRLVAMELHCRQDFLSMFIPKGSWRYYYFCFERFAERE